MDFSKLNLGSYLPTMPYAVRELFDKATNIVMNYTETEAKVVEATNDESWGPAGRLLQDLSQLSYSNEHYNELMGMLWKRCFTQDKRYWRRTYKSLLVITYLLRNGNEKVIRSVREHLYDLRSLENFTYHDDHGKDQGINIRHKAKELIEFIQDEDRVHDERKKAKVNRDKYVGMSNESSYLRHNNRWNDNDESKPRDFNERAKSKTVDDFTKVKDFSNDDYSFDKSNDKNQNLKTNKKNDSSKTQNAKTSSSVDNLASIQKKTEVIENDLLGDDLDFTPYVSAPQIDDFGQFQEATIPIQPAVCPTAPPPPPSSSITFDPFESLEPHTTNLFQPTLFPSHQPQKPIFNAPMVQQQTFMQPPVQTKANNTWSSIEGKIDISLNNLIPHTRGNTQKNSLTLNQLTSPANSSFPSMNNSNTQPIFSSKK